MAKQVGPVLFTGTIDGLIFYKLGDKYYTRSKGSYKSAKHMRRNPKYKRTMEKADQFGKASNLAQELYYRHVPKDARKHGLFGKLTGMVNRWLQEGKSKDEVQELLIAYCQTLAPKAKAATTDQPTSANTQPLPVIDPPSITTAQNPPRSTNNAQRSTPKQARYLSKWRVKRNGRLHIPKTVTTVCQLSASSIQRADLNYTEPLLKQNE